MPNIHPLLTHFPIALLSVSLAFDVIGVLRNNEQLERMGWWLQLLGTIGLAATVTSGLIAKAGVSIPEVGQTTFQTHQQIAFLVAALSAVLILWRIACRTHLPLKMRGVYLAAFAATIVLMWIGAWYGGELIYTFGVGVQLKN